VVLARIYDAKGDRQNAIRSIEGVGKPTGVCWNYVALADLYARAKDPV